MHRLFAPLLQAHANVLENLRAEPITDPVPSSDFVFHRLCHTHQARLRLCQTDIDLGMGTNKDIDLDTNTDIGLGMGTNKDASHIWDAHMDQHVLVRSMDCSHL